MVEWLDARAVASSRRAWRQPLDDAHHLGAAAEGADRHAAADALGQAEQVGLDAELLGRAAVGEHDPGLDLVEDEHDAVLRGQLADPLQEARLAAARRRC